MNNRLAIPALAAVLAAFSVSATAQVTIPKTSKSLPTITGWSHDSDIVTDVWTDADGNRYIVGQSTTAGVVDGFLVKTNKRGVLASGFPVNIDLGTSEAPSAVAVDATGNIFVADNVGALPHMIKYDASGNFLGSCDMFYNGTVNDILIGADGCPVSVGQAIVSGVTYSGVIHWLADASDWDTWFAFGNGNHYSIGMRPDGYLVMAGNRVISATDTYSSLTTVDPTFASGQRLSFQFVVGGLESFTEVSPSGTYGLATGWNAPTVGATNPEFAAVQDTYSGGVWTPVGNGYGFDYSTGGQGVGAGTMASSDGSVFVAVNGGTAVGPRYIDVYKGTLDTGLGTVTLNWGDEIAAADNQTMVDFQQGPDNTVAGLVRDETVLGAGPAAYQAYNLYAWTPLDRGDRKQLGSKFQKIPTTAPVAYPNTLMSYSGGKFLLAFAPIEATTAGAFPGEFKAGPNDSYKTDEDTTLTIGLAKSLLVNDPNFFTLDPLTASYHAGSASAGLASVTVNPNGSFTAVPVANFNGVATFTYDVTQDASIIATYTATITVKAKNDAPTANDDSFSVAMNSAVQNLDVLANDTDIDGDTPLTLVSKTNSANATIGLTPDKLHVTFKPKPGFSGIVTFTYTMKDPSGLQSTATVTVTVS